MNTKQNIISSKTFIGNDIVSLNCKHNIRSFNNEKYIEKILNQTEYDYYLKSEFKSVIPPLLWSCKESAYKVLLQKGLKKSFSPKLFGIELIKTESLSGNQLIRAESLCLYKNYSIFCRSTVENDFIHTSASLNDYTFEKLLIRTMRLQNITNENQSKITYELLLKSISACYSLNYSDLIIKKDNDGAPAIYLKNELLHIPFSISHDYNCVALIFLKNY